MGIIVDSSNRFARLSEISESRILNHLQALTGERHPETTPAALQASAAYLYDQMKSFGLETRKGPIDAQTALPFHNIIGQLSECSSENKNASKERLVIGAHYDTVAESPGADDNASGLAVLLEVARFLAPMCGRLIPEFVGFSLEEPGFIGSSYYLQEVERERIPIWGAIVLECVGYTNRQPGSQKVPPGVPIALPDQGDFIGLVGNASAILIQNAFESAVKNDVPRLSAISLMVPGNGEAVPDTRRSDHVPFWDKGYRAVMLTDTANFRNPHYHLESDRLETLDIPFITDVARALAVTVIELAGLKTTGTK